MIARPLRSPFGVLLGAAIAAATVALAQTPSPSSAAAKTAASAAPDPDHARLLAMCGTWDADMTFWFKPGSPGIPVKATSIIRSILNDLFIEERIEGALMGKPFTTLAWTGYNGGARQYEATRIATTNTARVAEAGAYDAASNRFELKAEYLLAGEAWHQRTVIQQTSADAMTATSYLSFGKVPEWAAVEIKYSRRAK